MENAVSVYAANTSGASVTPDPQGSTQAGKETYAWNGDQPPAIGSPEKIEVIISLRKQMGKTPYTLTKAERDTVTSALGQLKLKGYDYDKSVIEPVTGGGTLVILHYNGNKTITYCVSAKNMISVQEGESGSLRYFADESNAYTKLENILTGLLTQMES